MANNKNLTPFKKGDPKINRNGQPRKLITDTIKQLQDMGIKATTKTEIVGVYLRLINTSFDDLKAIEKDETQSALVRIIAKSILSGKGFEIIEKMLDRGIGKPTERAEIVSKTKEFRYTPEQRDREIKRLIEKGRLN